MRHSCRSSFGGLAPYTASHGATGGVVAAQFAEHRLDAQLVHRETLQPAELSLKALRGLRQAAALIAPCQPGTLPQSPFKAREGDSRNIAGVELAQVADGPQQRVGVARVGERAGAVAQRHHFAAVGDLRQARAQQAQERAGLLQVAAGVVQGQHRLGRQRVEPVSSPQAIDRVLHLTHERLAGGARELLVEAQLVGHDPSLSTSSPSARTHFLPPPESRGHAIRRVERPAIFVSVARGGPRTIGCVPSDRSRTPRRALAESRPLGTRLVQAWRALDREQQLAGCAAWLLFVSMFLPWYQQNAVVRASATGPLVSRNLSAFAVFSFVEALVLLLAAGVIALLFARAERRPLRLPASDGALIMGAGGWIGLLLVYGCSRSPASAATEWQRTSVSSGGSSSRCCARGY